MADEIKTDETKTDDATTEQQTDDVRQSAAFRGVQKEAARYRDELAALKAQIAEDKEASERKALESAQNWDALKAKYEADIAAERAAAEALRIKTDLAIAGVHDPDHAEFLMLKFQRAEGDDLAAWIADAKENDSLKLFFGVVDPETREPLPAQSDARGAPRSSTANWAQIKADLASSDRDKLAAADKAVRAFVLEHGKMPPGFSQ